MGRDERLTKKDRRSLEEVLRFYNRRRVLVTTANTIQAMVELDDLEKSFATERKLFGVTEADLAEFAAQQFDGGIKRWGKPKSGRAIRDAVRARCPWLYDEDSQAQVVPVNHKEHAVGSMSQYAKRQLARGEEGTS